MASNQDIELNFYPTEWGGQVHLRGEKLPSLNDLLSKPSKRIGIKLFWRRLFGLFIRGELGGRPPYAVDFNFFEPDERRDIDNVISGGAKVILDSLQHCGLIGDDNRKWIREVRARVVTRKRDPGVIVNFYGPDEPSNVIQMPGVRE